MSMSPDERDEMTELRRRCAGALEDRHALEVRLADQAAVIRDLETQLQELSVLRQKLRDVTAHRDRLLWEKNAILEQGNGGVDTVLVAVDPAWAPQLLADWSPALHVRLEAVDAGHRMTFRRVAA